MTTSLGNHTRSLLALSALALTLGAVTSPAAHAAAAATSGEPTLISYQTAKKFGKTVHTSAQVKRLKGAPADFTAFVGALADKLQADAGECDGAAIGVTVAKVRTDGYALGGVNDCGGYQALWAKVDGTWREIDGTQDSLECRTLHKYRVPSSIAGTSCYNYKQNKAHTYHQA